MDSGPQPPVPVSMPRLPSMDTGASRDPAVREPRAGNARPPGAACPAALRAPSSLRPWGVLSIPH